MKLGGMLKNVFLDRVLGSGFCKRCHPSSMRHRAITVIKYLDWLLKGWITELKTKETGVNVGTTYKVLTNTPISALDNFHDFQHHQNVYCFPLSIIMYYIFKKLRIMIAIT
jgi:hypothetical protein